MAETPPARDPTPTRLTPEEFGQLFDAFLDSFSSKSHLERVVAFSFTGVDLADIADGDLRTITAALIRWADAQNALPTLIADARMENTGNQKLEEVGTYWRNRPTRSPTSSSDGTSSSRDDLGLLTAEALNQPAPATIRSAGDNVRWWVERVILPLLLAVISSGLAAVAVKEFLGGDDNGPSPMPLPKLVATELPPAHLTFETFSDAPWRLTRDRVWREREGDNQFYPVILQLFCRS